MATTSIFVNHVDGYSGNALAADLSLNPNSVIIGSLRGGLEGQVPSCVSHIVSRSVPEEYLKKLLKCDVLVYDLHDCDQEELDFVLQVFNQVELSKPMTVILISSLMCWARTPQEEEVIVETPPPQTTVQTNPADEEAKSSSADEDVDGENKKPSPPPPRPKPPPKLLKPNFIRPRKFTDGDYTRRVPSVRFAPWRSLESLILGLNGKKGCRACIIGSGIMYGNGEKALGDYFYHAWNQNLQALRIIGEGKNYIPTIHVRDLARFVRYVAFQPDDPQKAYYIATDKSDTNQFSIVNNIAKTFCPNAGSSKSEKSAVEKLNSIDNSNAAEDVNNVASAVTSSNSESSAQNGIVQKVHIEQAILAENADIMMANMRFEPSDIVHKFRMWCEDGLSSMNSQSLATVAKEYVRWNDLQPIKAVVVGPAGSIDRLLQTTSSHYGIEIITPQILVEDFLSNESDAVSELGEAVKANFNGETLPDQSLLAQVLHYKVRRPPAQWKGYILKNFVTTHAEADVLFTETVDVTQYPETTGDEGDAAEQLEPVYEKRVVEEGPNIIIVCSASEEMCALEGQLLELGDLTSATERYKKAFVDSDETGRVTRWFWENRSVATLDLEQTFRKYESFSLRYLEEKRIAAEKAANPPPPDESANSLPNDDDLGAGGDPGTTSPGGAAGGISAAEAVTNDPNAPAVDGAVAGGANATGEGGGVDGAGANMAGGGGGGGAAGATNQVDREEEERLIREAKEAKLKREEDERLAKEAKDALDKDVFDAISNSCVLEFKKVIENTLVLRDIHYFKPDLDIPQIENINAAVKSIDILNQKATKGTGPALATSGSSGNLKDTTTMAADSSETGPGGSLDNSDGQKDASEAKLADDKKAREEVETKEMERLRNEESAQLEAISEPLREYMQQYVTPTVTEALIEICRVQPSDPVDYLAEFLFARSEEVPWLEKM